MVKKILQVIKIIDLKFKEFSLLNFKKPFATLQHFVNSIKLVSLCKMFLQ